MNTTYRIHLRVANRFLSWTMYLAGLALLFASPTHLHAEESDIFKNLRREHPRLFLSSAEWATLKKQISGDRLLQRWFDAIANEADDIRATTPLIPPDPPQSIGTMDARINLARMTTVAGIYKLTGNKALANRIREEVLAIAKYPDWSPGSFLACAETMSAEAIGYDWGYELFSPEERALIRRAIVEKGLKPSLDYYRNDLRWANRGGNWSEVCNGSLIVAALAVADEEPDIASQILTLARENIRHALDQLNPDGGWSEGQGYWCYGKSYLMSAIAALESALGTDLDLKKTPGLANTGSYRMHTTGPNNYVFNFSDCGELPYPAPWMFWLARQYNRPEYAIHERRLWETAIMPATNGAHPDIFMLIWSGGIAPPSKLPSDLKRDALFRNIDTAFFRSAWEDPSATYVGFKCGYNNHGHGHLDYGSFILDSQQERWALDLGPEYYVEGYFTERRWSFFRARNEAHNTLTIDGGIQDSRIRAPIVAFLSTPDRAYAVGDLSKTYHLPDQTLRRGIALLNRRDVLVQDDIAADKPLDVVWNMYTRAKVSLQGQRATLTLRGARMNANLLSPAGAEFELAAVKAPPEQTQQPDVHCLRIRLRAGGVPERIAVLFSPAENAKPPRLEPLSDWIKAAPVEQ